jgi:hypothetical protein
MRHRIPPRRSTEDSKMPWKYLFLRTLDYLICVASSVSGLNGSLPTHCCQHNNVFSWYFGIIHTDFDAGNKKNTICSSVHLTVQVPLPYDNCNTVKSSKVKSLTSWSHSLPSLCNFVDILIFTLQRLCLFSLYNTTCFCLTGHDQMYKTLD